MPPKRKNTRATKKKNEGEVAEQETPEVEEPPKKQSRKRGRKKVEEEPEEDVPVEVEEEKEKTKEQIEPEPVVVERPKQVPPTKKSPELLPIRKSFPTSPSKRVSSVSSRIPSPLKKHSLSTSSKPDLDFRKTEHAINQQFTSKNLPKLTQIIDDLKSSKAEHLFDELKNSTEVRFKTSDDLINSLSSRNQQLSTDLEELRSRLAEFESNGVAAPVISEANEEESFRNELILDMMEQIVGLRIHNVEDTDEALSFDCSQSGKNGVLDYKLTIPKEDSSEIIYTPINREETYELKDFLPEYFFDDLTFPIDTLQQFYHKIYRGLNK